MDSLASAFERTVEEGELRLTRSWSRLVTTGLVGGADVGLGVFALFLVKEKSHSDLLASLAFSIGFIALTLANSELFTEDFLVPIAAVVAKRATVADLARLWIGTLVANLVAGWLFMGLVVDGFPEITRTAVEVAAHYPAIGLGWRSFAGALIGGAVITLMTWMQHSTESVGARIVAAIAAAFLLAVAPLNHAIVVSLEMFAALQVGAPFGYLSYFEVLGWYTLGNVIGGVVLVGALRLVQVGSGSVREQRDASEV